MVLAVSVLAVNAGISGSISISLKCGIGTSLVYICTILSCLHFQWFIFVKFINMLFASYFILNRIQILDLKLLF